MNSISLAMHHVRIRRQREKEFDQIDFFGDSDDDLFDILQGILALGFIGRCHAPLAR